MNVSFPTLKYLSFSSLLVNKKLTIHTSIAMQQILCIKTLHSIMGNNKFRGVRTNMMNTKIQTKSIKLVQFFLFLV